MERSTYTVEIMQKGRASDMRGKRLDEPRGLQLAIREAAELPPSLKRSKAKIKYKVKKKP